MQNWLGHDKAQLWSWQASQKNSWSSLVFHVNISTFDRIFSRFSWLVFSLPLLYPEVKNQGKNKLKLILLVLFFFKKIQSFGPKTIIRTKDNHSYHWRKVRFLSYSPHLVHRCIWNSSNKVIHCKNGAGDFTSKSTQIKMRLACISAPHAFYLWSMNLLVNLSAKQQQGQHENYRKNYIKLVVFQHIESRQILSCNLGKTTVNQHAHDQ